MSQFVIVCMLMLAFNLKPHHTVVQGSLLGFELSFISRWSWTVWYIWTVRSMALWCNSYFPAACGEGCIVKHHPHFPRICPYPCLPLGCLWLSSVSLWPPLPLDGERVRVLGLLELRTPMEALRWFCRKHPRNPKQTRASELILQQFNVWEHQQHRLVLSTCPGLGLVAALLGGTRVSAWDTVLSLLARRSG